LFDFIRKPLVWAAWDQELDKALGKTQAFELKSMQDLAVYYHLRHAEGGRIAEVGAGNSRILPALARANECVAVEKFEGEGGGPTKEAELPGVEVVSAYLGDFDPRLEDASFDVVFSISVVEHVGGVEPLAAFHSDQLRILKPGGIFLHAVDLYLEDEPTSQFINRYETLRGWVVSADGVEPLGDVAQMPLRFSCDMATNPDNIMHSWGKAAPALDQLRQTAQGVSLLIGGRKLSGTHAPNGTVT